MNMKRLLTLTSIMIIILTASVLVQANDLKLSVDGKIVVPTVAPVIDNGVTLVPMRFISEILGASVNWDGSQQKATLETASYTVVFTIGSTSYSVNNQVKTLLNAPQLINGSTMLPLRAFSEAIGAEVGYDQATSTVSVDYFSNMTGNLIITGSTTVQPIAQAAADRLSALNNGLSISVAGGGSGAGVNDTIAGTNHLGMSSRELTEAELAQIKPVAIANDGIAIIVHPSNAVKELTMEQAKQIFLGEIRNWQEVGGANAPVLVVTRETGSGTRSTFEEMLLAKKPVVETATPVTSSELVKLEVAREANAIGYDSIGFVENTVKAVVLEGIMASADTVNSGAYPMGRELFMLVGNNATTNAAKFIDYLHTSEVQREIVGAEGYIPLP